MPITTEYSNRLRLPPARLRLDDIESVARLITDEGLPLQFISTHHGVTTVTATSLEEFIQQSADFPDELYVLTMLAQNHQHSHLATRRIMIEGNRRELEVTLRDNDADAVLGKERRLAEFFMRRRPLYGYMNIKSVIEFGIIPVALCSIVVAVSLIIWLLTPAKGDKTLIWHYPVRDLMLLFGLVALSFGTASLAFRSTAIERAMPHLSVEVRRPHRALSLATVSAYAGIVGLVATIASFFVGH